MTSKWILDYLVIFGGWSMISSGLKCLPILGNPSSPWRDIGAGNDLPIRWNLAESPWSNTTNWCTTMCATGSFFYPGRVRCFCSFSWRLYSWNPSTFLNSQPQATISSQFCFNGCGATPSLYLPISIHPTADAQVLFFGRFPVCGETCWAPLRRFQDAQWTCCRLALGLGERLSKRFGMAWNWEKRRESPLDDAFVSLSLIHSSSLWIAIV